MVNLHSSKVSIFSSLHSKKILFGIIWILGLLLGRYISLLISPEIQPIIYDVTTADTSFIGLIFSFLFALLVSAFLLCRRLPLLVLPIIFLKAVFFSYCSSAITLSLGNAGWLLSRLYMLSDGFAVIVLLWFWLRCITGEATAVKKYSILSIVAMCLICYFDYSFVSPFAMMLFNQ